MRYALAIAACLVASQSLAQVCDDPLSPEVCEAMDAMGTVNVRCAIQSQPPHAYTHSVDPLAVWASPNDDCDDTAGIVAALAKAHVAREVFLPPGDGTDQVAPYATRPYLISAPINISSRRLRGLRVSNSNHGTRVQLAPNVALAAAQECHSVPLVDLPTQNPFNDCGSGSLFRSTNAATISDLVIDAEGADFGLVMHKNHGGQISGLAVSNAGMAGVQVEQSGSMSIRDVTASFNDGDGVRIIGSNGTTATMVRATVNGRHGVVLAGWRPTDPVPHTGECNLHGGNIEINGGHGLYASRVTGVVAGGFRLEGNAWDGARVEDSQNVTVRDVRVIQSASIPHDTISGEAKWHSIAVYGSADVSVENVVVGGGSLIATDFWSESTVFLDVRGSYWMGSGVNGVYDTVGVRTPDANGGAQRIFFTARRMFAANAQPTVGGWRYGDIVWNATPWTGEVLGWICRNTTAYGHECLLWMPLQTLANP